MLKEIFRRKKRQLCAGAHGKKEEPGRLQDVGVSSWVQGWGKVSKRILPVARSMASAGNWKMHSSNWSKEHVMKRRSSNTRSGSGFRKIEL